MPTETPPELIVTNLNRNFTGVSATIDQLLRFQEHNYDLLFSGSPLPAVRSKPVSIWNAIAKSRRAPRSRQHILWHVRRNCEMFWAIFARDVLRFPIKTVFTSAAIRRHSAFPRFLISKMDAVIATSPKAAKFVPNVVAVVPHGVDTTRFQPAENRSLAWQNTGYPGTSGIATVGRVRPEKGTDLFVDTMIRVLPNRPGTTALIIGKTDAKFVRFKAVLERRIAEAGLSDRILFAGEIEKAALPDILSALSLLVAVPRYEGYGMTPLEAMASGTPVVVSDTGAFSTFVANGKSGLLVPVGDLGQTYDAVSNLLDDSLLAESMAQGARETAESEFSVDRELQGIGQVYQSLWQDKAIVGERPLLVRARQGFLKQYHKYIKKAA
ncbi:MAG: glycosyltransferase family 4 protein [Planctomycetes bacterium]|nr:glycosyltransferase family 4 protein [Planctomycetota bacterium]